MELTPRTTRIRWTDARRIIPSRFPVVGLLDRVATPDELDTLFELESWTNDRISAELGILNTLPAGEWVTGRPMATVVMAAFCHPREGGGRFSGPDRGAWYAARALETALAESIYHRTQELAEVGVFETRVEMRLYLSDFRAPFHDLRDAGSAATPYLDPVSYQASQALGRRLLETGSNGIVYESVRHAGG